MTTVFLKVISGILQQHEELLRKYKKKALTLKDYDGIFLKAHTTNGRTYFTGHRPGKKPKYIGNEKHTTVQRIQNLRATKVLISMLESNIAALKHFQDNYIDITTEEIRKRLPKCYVPANLRGESSRSGAGTGCNSEVVPETAGIKGIYTGEISRKMHCFHH